MLNISFKLKVFLFYSFHYTEGNHNKTADSQELCPSHIAHLLQIHSLLPICDNVSEPLMFFSLTSLMSVEDKVELFEYRTLEIHCRRKGFLLSGSSMLSGSSYRAVILQGLVPAVHSGSNTQ